MGVLNLTPDSFSDGGAHVSDVEAIEYGLRLLDAGADIIDIGGESTRPGADAVDEQTEIARVAPVVQALAAQGGIVSIDTMKPAVARMALDAGAEIINDVSGFRDPAMRSIAAESGAGIVIMHMLGTPRTMQLSPNYRDVVSEVSSYLAGQARLCRADGVEPGAVCVDPGIGFGKSIDHNLELLAGLGEIVALGHPVLVGASRKSFLGRLLDIPVAADRDLATAIVTAMAVERGVAVVRVHDVAGSLCAAQLAQAIVVAGVERRERQR